MSEKGLKQQHKEALISCRDEVWLRMRVKATTPQASNGGFSSTFKY
jgi:hypothetical protein